MLGIKNRYGDFTRQAGPRDIRAFQHLHKFADNNIVTKVERAALTQQDLEFLGKAIRGRKVITTECFSCR